MYEALTIIAFLLAMCFMGLLIWVTWRLGDLLAYQRQNSEDIAEINATIHTRQARASMRSGVEDEQAPLKRLRTESSHPGVQPRSKRSRRVVVGGDPDSGLNQSLGQEVDDASS